MDTLDAALSEYLQARWKMLSKKTKLLLGITVQEKYVLELLWTCQFYRKLLDKALKESEL